MTEERETVLTRDRVAAVAAEHGWTVEVVNEGLDYRYRKGRRYLECRFGEYGTGRCLSARTARHAYATTRDAYAVLRGEKY